MDHSFSSDSVAEMQRRLASCQKYIDALGKGCLSDDKTNTLLDAAMQQIELCCIRMRHLCEHIRPPTEWQRSGRFIHREIFGSVTVSENNWVDIRLDALLPHCTVIGGTQYVADSITRLLDHYSACARELPMFDKAYVAIAEHCSPVHNGAFDQDNKGFKGVINALKGRLFRDDDQFELALGLFTVEDWEECCHVYVIPFEDVADFMTEFTERIGS